MMTMENRSEQWYHILKLNLFLVVVLLFARLKKTARLNDICNAINVTMATVFVSFVAIQCDARKKMKSCQ